MALFFLLVTLSSAGLVSCGREQTEEMGTATEATQPVRMSLTLGEGRVTKANVDLITEMGDEEGRFRGIADLRLLPFASRSAVSPGDAPLSGTVYFPALVSPRASREEVLYFTQDVYLPRRCASALLYGKARRAGNKVSGSVADRQVNGSLVESENFYRSTMFTAADFGFSPDAMLPSGNQALAATRDIVSALNDVFFGVSYAVNVTYNGGEPTTVTVNWNSEIGDENLRSCYSAVTEEGKLMPGSGGNVEALLTTLYRTIDAYESQNTLAYEVEKNGSFYTAYKQEDGSVLQYKDLYNGLCQAIKDKFSACENIAITGDKSVVFRNSATSSYPESYGLPSGAAAVRWTPSGYVVPLESGLDGMAPISRFCFPPALYYYANSPLVSSTSDEVLGYYSGEHTWESILSHYTDGPVTVETKAVAVENTLEYAVGMLKATVQAASGQLQDNDGLDYTLVDASGDHLPLKGVIIGCQYPQKYDFTPDTESAQYFLYDSQVSGVFLKPYEEETLPDFRVLSLETPENQTVYICLEFENNTGKTFYGAEGRILPGHRFYLTGSLDLPENAAFNSVFLKDRITTVKCKVTTLENAHCAIPDLGVPQLTLGLQTKVSWILSTPVTVIME
ncbi:MAG: hypothetical protein J6M31_08130 [Bacteroidales bacterium]|nr:hypothetical protein [Bacteroidales bacterium]